MVRRPMPASRGKRGTPEQGGNAGDQGSGRMPLVGQRSVKETSKEAGGSGARMSEKKGYIHLPKHFSWGKRKKKQLA